GVQEAPMVSAPVVRLAEIGADACQAGTGSRHHAFDEILELLAGNWIRRHCEVSKLLPIGGSEVKPVAMFNARRLHLQSRLFGLTLRQVNNGNHLTGSDIEVRLLRRPIAWLKEDQVTTAISKEGRKAVFRHAEQERFEAP